MVNGPQFCKSTRSSTFVFVSVWKKTPQKAAMNTVSMIPVDKEDDAIGSFESPFGLTAMRGMCHDIGITLTAKASPEVDQGILLLRADRKSVV